MAENNERTWAQRLRDMARAARAEKAVFNESNAKEWLTDVLRKADERAAEGRFGLTAPLGDLNEAERRYVLDHLVDDYGFEISTGGQQNSVFVWWTA